MTYLAPRQKLFAIVLLISFCLHTLLFILTTDRQITENRLHKAEKIVDQLISEATLSVSYEDRVSLSVIASRYTSEHDVNRIVIRNAEGVELIQVGSSPMNEGANVSKLAIRNNAVIGKIELTMKATDKAEILKTSKFFVLGAFLIHFLLWIVYIAFARPTKEQLKLLSKDIHKHYLKKYGVDRLRSDKTTRSRERINSNSSQKATISEMTKEIDDKESLLNTNQRKLKKKAWAGIRSSINQKVHEQQISTPSESFQNNISQAKEDSAINTNVVDQEIDPDSSELYISKPKYTFSPVLDKMDISSEEDKIQQVERKISFKDEVSTFLLKQKEPEETGLFRIESEKLESASIGIDTSQQVNNVRIQCRYIDKHDLLKKLSIDVAEPYLQLCTQLITKAIFELLKLEILKGIVIKENPVFTVDGAIIELYHRHDNEETLALAGVISGILFKMINEFVYEKHREISRFALTLAIGVSQPGRENAMLKLIENKAKDHDVLVLFAKTETNFVEKYINLHYLPNPTNVSERECAFVDGIDDTINDHLINIRNKVLKL